MKASQLIQPSSKEFWLITLGNFSMFLNVSMFFLLPLHIQALGGDEALIGIIMGSFGITVLIAIPWISPAIDQYGSRRFMIIGLILTILATLGYTLIHKLGLPFLLLRLVQGLGFAMTFNAATTAVTWRIPQDRLAQGLGIFGAFVIVSHAIGPAIGESIVARWGFEPYFPIAAVFSLTALLLIIRVPSDRPDVQPPSRTRFVRLVTRKQLAAPLWATVFAGASLGSLINFLAVYTAAWNLKVSTFFTTYAICVAAVRFLGGRISDLFGRQAVLLPALTLSGVALAAVALAHTSMALGIIGVIFGISQGLLYPALNALVVDRTRPEERGTAVGAFNASFTFGINIFTFGFGAIAKYLGFGIMYMIAGAGLWLAALLLTLDSLCARWGDVR